MIIVLIAIVGVGIMFYCMKNYFDEIVPYILIITFALLMGVTVLAPNATHYEDYTESYSLQQISDGNYYDLSDDKIKVMILDGNVRKIRMFPIENVDFVNGNTASIQILGEKATNSKILEMLFFVKPKKKNKVKDVILSIPESNSIPATE